MNLVIREVLEEDLGAVTSVYNHFISHSLAAYPDQPVNTGFFRDKLSQLGAFPFLVVEIDGVVSGFAYLSPFHFAATMRRTAALTYFLHPNVTSRGIGSELLERLIRDGKRLGVANFLANISSHNEGSVRFHKRHGFVECGRFLEVGAKSGRPFNMIWMQRIDADDAVG